MRTPAQRTASRANRARSRGPKTEEGKLRSTTKPFLHDQLAKATVVKKESPEGSQELVQRFMLRIAPRDPVEEICSATWWLHACGALAGRNPHFYLLIQSQEIRLQTIIRRALARIQALRRLGPQKEFGKIALVKPPSGRTSHAPKP